MPSPPPPPPKKPASGDAKHLVIERAKRMDRDHVTKIVSKNVGQIPYMSKTLRRNKDFMLELVQANPRAINFLDNKLMLKAIKRDVGVLAYISSNFASDYKFWVQALSVVVKALRYAPSEMLKDYEFWPQALSVDVKALRYAPSEMLNDYEFWPQALSVDVKALRYAPSEMLNDYEFWPQALSVDVNALRYASAEMLDDYDFLVQAFNVDVNALGYASPEMLKHFNIGQHMADRAFWAAQEGGKHKTKLFISNRDRALYVLKHAKNALAIISEELNGDKDVVLEAWRDGMHIQDDESPLLWCKEALYEDESFVKQLLVKAPNNAGEILEMTDGEGFEGFSKEFYIEACEQNMLLCETLPKKVLSGLVAAYVRKAAD